MSGPWSISLNPFFLHDGVLKAKGCAAVWVWVVVLALWGQLKSKFILGYQLSPLSQCRAPGTSCCCKTNHTAGAISLFSWAFPSPGPHGAVVCTELPWRCIAPWQLPTACGSIWLGAPAAKVGLCRWGLGCWPGSGSVLLLAVRAACRALLGGFASSQTCSPGGTNPGCCTELWEKSYQKCQLCDVCCGTAESCFHCCLTPCQHYFWKAV